MKRSNIVCVVMRFVCNHKKMNHVAFYACSIYLDQYNYYYIFTDYLVHNCFLDKCGFFLNYFFCNKQNIVNVNVGHGYCSENKLYR